MNPLLRKTIDRITGLTVCAIGLGLGIEPPATSVLFIVRSTRGIIPHTTLALILVAIGLLIATTRLSPRLIIACLMPVVWIFAFQSVFLWNSPTAPKWPIPAYIGYTVTFIAFYIHALRVQNVKYEQDKIANGKQ